MPVFRYTFGEGEADTEGSGLAGCERANSRKDVPDDPPFTECCIRMCWSDECVVDWDLWVRERTEPGTGPMSSTKWVSYLNLGPVGETGMEMAADTSKEGEEGNDVCGTSNDCGVSAGPNGFAGEIVCFCLSDSMTYPKTFDVVINLFGADQLACPDPLGTVCVEYSCCDDEFCDVTFSDTITGVFDFQGKGTMGNDGAGDYPFPTIIAESPACLDKFLGSTSTCWVLTGIRANGRKFVNRGGGRAPDKFIIPDDVDERTCILIEDGIKIPRSMYSLLHDSVAAKAGVSRTAIVGRSGSKRSKRTRSNCPKCKKRKRKSLF